MEILSTHAINAPQFVQNPQKVSNSQSINHSVNVAATNRRDEVSFSQSALRASETAQTESSSIRFDLVNRIKAEIASGAYESADKMDIAVDRLLTRMNPR